MLLMRVACSFLLVFVVLMSSDVSAADYKVSYAIYVLDSGDNDSGTATCEYKSDCKIKSEKLKVSITLRSRDPIYWNRVNIEISGDGPRSGCCYFEDGADRVVRDLRDSPIRLGVYVGRRRSRASEFLINEPFGILHLQFLDEQ